MEKDETKHTPVEKEEEKEKEVTEAPAPDNSGGGGGGWGGWGFSPLSYISDLQKAAAAAAEEISRNAAAVAQSIADDEDDSAAEGEDGDEDEREKIRKAALEKLENAGGDILSQGLKVIDDSVENFASEAWRALGSAWKGSSQFIKKLEHSVAESVQDGETTGSTAPSLLETGKAMTFRGIQVLENVGKETMDLLISEAGFEVEKKSDEADLQVDEEVSFDRCFYIYGGPEQLEELEALSSHYALVFNRRKTKLSPELKSLYESMVKQVQQILNLNTEIDGTAAEPAKGKKIDSGTYGSVDEMKNLRDSSVSMAGDMASGFMNALAGLAANDIVQRSTGRLESIHSEGIHRLSEICCFAASQLLLLAKSVISSANKGQEENIEEDAIKINWPEDSLEKAKIIRSRAQSMAESLEAVSNSFITGISDVSGAYLAAMKASAADEAPSEESIQDKASKLSERLRADQITAVSKIQDGLQNLCFVVVSTSMPSA